MLDDLKEICAMYAEAKWSERILLGFGMIVWVIVAIPSLLAAGVQAILPKRFRPTPRLERDRELRR